MAELKDKFKNTKLVQEYLSMHTDEELGRLFKSFWDDMPNKSWFTEEQKRSLRFSAMSLYVHSCQKENLGKYPSPFLPKEGH